MVNIQQFTVQWGGSVSGTSVFHFLSGSGLTGDNADNLDNFLSAWMTFCHDSVTYAIDNEGSSYDSADGQTVGGWTLASTGAGVGQVDVGATVAQATQGLIRWRTNVIRGRRPLLGRNYLPGLDQSYIAGGELATSVINPMNAAANLFRNHGQSTPVIWGRPRVVEGVNQGDGVFGAITGGTMWSELATQRPRRRA